MEIVKSLQILLFISILKYINCSRFYIDFDNNTFVKDSQPFRYVSGSIHPYRVPNELWEDRLTKIWAGGLNAIQTYIAWNEHEPYLGVYDFEGQNDIFRFLDIAQKIGFVVIIRPGPYICGEHEYGGLPWWLLANGTDSIIPRSSEKNFMTAVKRWYSVLLPKLVPYLYKNGGPIITVQIENEYGFYFACDKNYTQTLRDLFFDSFGRDVVLFTTDPPSPYMQCGVVQDSYATVDFGPDSNPKEAFDYQRKYSPNGPLVNSEFWTGWIDLWGSPHSKTSTELIVKSLDIILSLNANVNFYMFHGGTNYGFSNGASSPPYVSQLTTYDYDAPISEAGDITNKFMAIRKTISKYLPIPKVPIPKNMTKLDLGRIQMTHHVPLVDVIAKMSNMCIKSIKPQSFERLGQGYGFVLYKAILDDPNVDGKILSIPGIRDRAYIQIGTKWVGVLYRSSTTSLTIDLPGNTNKTLFIIVENMGRINGGNLLDTKGILYDVYLDGIPLNNWVACLTNNFIPNYQRKFHSSHQLLNFLKRNEHLLSKKNTKDLDFRIPAIYIGEFSAPDTDFDTFLKMDKFQKGIGLIHSNTSLTNLGRYWPNVGPQVTLYTPGVFLTKRAINHVILVEFENSKCQITEKCYVELIDYPIIDNLRIN